MKKFECSYVSVLLMTLKSTLLILPPKARAQYGKENGKMIGSLTHRQTV
jgi:hypothetical protein